jgi:hypothetical protein
MNTAAVCGPELPVAYCRSCSTQLTFERRVFRGRLSSSTGWRCHCEGCVDGEYLESGLHIHVRSGEGDSPWEALDDCAAMQWDLMPEELLVKDEPEPASERSPEDTYMGQYYNGQRNWREEEGS